MKKVISSGLLAGLGMVVAGALISYLLGLIFPSVQAEYQGNPMFRPWSDPLMSLIFVAPFIVGLVMASIWPKMKAACHPDKPCCENGVCLGLTYWFISLAGMVISYSTFRVSLLMVATWTIGGLVQALAGGWIIVKMNK